MRIYYGQVPNISDEIVSTLIADNSIEVEASHVSEVEADLTAVLKEYIRRDRELNETARDLIAARRHDSQGFGRIKKQLAERERFGIGDDAVEYIIVQLIEMLLQSRFVEEVYAEDRDIRRIMAPILKRSMQIDDELDHEVRSKIRNLQEGSMSWDVEYKKVMAKVKRNKRL